MARSLMERAAPQFIRESLSRATPAARVASLVEVHELLEGNERDVFVRALAERLVREAGHVPIEGSYYVRNSDDISPLPA